MTGGTHGRELARERGELLEGVLVQMGQDEKSCRRDVGLARARRTDGSPPARGEGSASAWIEGGGCHRVTDGTPHLQVPSGLLAPIPFLSHGIPASQFNIN